MPSLPSIAPCGSSSSPVPKSAASALVFLYLPFPLHLLSQTLNIFPIYLHILSFHTIQIPKQLLTLSLFTSHITFSPTTTYSCRPHSAHYFSPVVLVLVIPSIHINPIFGLPHSDFSYLPYLSSYPIVPYRTNTVIATDTPTLAIHISLSAPTLPTTSALPLTSTPWPHLS